MHKMYILNTKPFIVREGSQDPPDSLIPGNPCQETCIDIIFFIFVFQQEIGTNADYY